MKNTLYDIHTHTGVQKSNLYHENIFPREMGLRSLVSSYNWQIDKIVTFPMPWTDTNSVPYEQENKELIGAIEQEQVWDKILPFLCIHPRIKVSEQLEAIEKMIQNNKIYWFKFHTLDTKSYIDDFFNSSEIVSFCKQYNLPVLIHSANFDWYENCNGIFKYADKYRDINILIAHMMWFSTDFFSQLKDYKNDNLFFDCSPFLGMCKFADNFKWWNAKLDLPYNRPKQVLQFLYNRFPNNLVWWSDQPFWNFEIDKNTTAGYSIHNELQLLMSLNSSIINKIASKNSEDFLNI